MRAPAITRVAPILGVLAFTTACGANPVGVGSSPGSDSSQPNTDATVSELALDRACKEFAAGFGREDLTVAAAALQDVAAAIGSAFPEEASLATEVATALPSEGEHALARLVPVIPVLGREACAEVQEAVSAFTAAPEPNLGVIAADLAAARERWAAASINIYHYQGFFSTREDNAAGFQCGVDGYLVVQIVDSVPFEARDKSSGCVVDLEDPARPPLTVEELFDLIDSVISEPSDLREVHARFSDIGVPVEFFVASDSGEIEGGLNELTEGILENPQAERILGDLELARARWQSVGTTSYRFQVEVQCFCPEEYRGPFDVIVRNGAVFEVTRNGEPAGDIAPTDYLTVTGLFGAVERFAHSDGITVTYDPDYGFPVIIDADPLARAIDEEQRIVVTGFTVDDG